MSKFSTRQKFGLYALAFLCVGELMNLAKGIGMPVMHVLIVMFCALWFWRLYKKYQKQRQVNDAVATVAAEKVDFEEQLAQKVGHRPIRATVLGGSGTSLKPEQPVLLSCTKDRIIVTDVQTRKHQAIELRDLMSVEITGPGTQTSNAGLVGGGFGLTGAMKGIITAAVINKMTERSTTNTFIRVATPTAEVHFHVGDREPSELRMILSPAVVRVEASKTATSTPAKTGSSVAEELAGLHKLLQDGALTHEEFASAKQRLLS